MVGVFLRKKLQGGEINVNLMREIADEHGLIIERKRQNGR